MDSNDWRRNAMTRKDSSVPFLDSEKPNFYLSATLALTFGEC